MRRYLLAASCIAAMASWGFSGFAMADESATKVALVPGGPHPYFAAWEQAGKDAVRDFHLGAADYKVPPSGSVANATAASCAE